MKRDTNKWNKQACLDGRISKFVRYYSCLAENYLQIISLNLVLCLTKLVCLNIVFQSITRELNPVILSLIISLSFGSVSFSFYLMLTSLCKKVESAKNRGLKSLEIVHILTTEEHIVCLILYACRFYVSSCQLIYNNVFTVLL